MKILRLSLNNLASIAGTQDINFESAPLAHAGLIAITGKTGAGKSTLLDAMCLALYDQIPRLNGAAGALKDASGQGISIKDSKNILRRGCTQGFAELEFIALDQKRYLARWEVRRARNKVDGNLKVERAITAVEDQRVLTQKISECTPTVEKLIGLSFEQFTRAVLLAQSEVGAFLKAKDQDRADLLEYLTNSHIFSLVSQKAFEKIRQIRSEKEQLQQLMGHIELLSDEQLQALQQQHAQSKLSLHEKLQSEKLLLNDLSWYKQQHRLHSEIQAKKEFYLVQVDANQKMQPQRDLLAQLDQFQEIREQYLQQRQQQLQQQQLAQQLEQFQPEFQHCEQQHQQAQQQLEQLQHSAQQQQKEQLQLQPVLEQALQLDGQIEHLIQRYKEADAQLKQIQHEKITPLTTQQHGQQQHLQQLHTQLEHLEQQSAQHAFLAVFDREPHSILQRLQQFQKLQQQLQQQAPVHAHSSLAQLQQQLDDVKQQQADALQQAGSLAELEQQATELEQQQVQHQQHSQQLEQALFLLQHMLNEQQEQQQLQQHMTQLQAELSSLQQAQTEAQQHYQNAQTAREQLEQIFAQQRLSQAQSVQELRQQLQAEQPCMVCGSTEHPFVSHQDLLESALQSVQDTQLQQAQQQEQQCQQQLQQLQLQHSKQQTLLEQKQLRSSQLQDSVQQKHAAGSKAQPKHTAG
ncbi:AAA family ATPase [Acinetobacter indicus]